MSAAGAALEITHRYKSQSGIVAFSGTHRTAVAIHPAVARAMLVAPPREAGRERNGSSFATQFRQSVAPHASLMQPSYTESFNMGPPTVSPKVCPPWYRTPSTGAPEHWKP